LSHLTGGVIVRTFVPVIVLTFVRAFVPTFVRTFVPVFVPTLVLMEYCGKALGGGEIGTFCSVQVEVIHTGGVFDRADYFFSRGFITFNRTDSFILFGAVQNEVIHVGGVFNRTDYLFSRVFAVGSAHRSVVGYQVGSEATVVSVLALAVV
jgi:hypothetical protein